MDENKKAAQKKKISHFITIAVLVILFLAFIFPFIMVIFNAFKTKGDTTADPLALVGHGRFGADAGRVPAGTAGDGRRACTVPCLARAGADHRRGNLQAGASYRRV